MASGSSVSTAGRSTSALKFGVADFKIVDIDIKQIAEGLQSYLKRGSRITGVSLDDIDRSVISTTPPSEGWTVVTLLQRGMKLFDALVWLSAKGPADYPLLESVTMSQDNIPSLNDVARALFYCYFFLITQARYPVASSSDEKPKVAKFLVGVMLMEDDQSTYIKKICSFEATKFDPAWIRYVSFSGFGQEAMSRFGLGVAGYRLFGPFKAYSPRPDLPENLRNAVTFATTVAKASPSWDVHPVTRAPRVLTKRGNLNKNLSNLIRDVFTEAQIAEMVASKMLYAAPQHEANYKDYRTWAPEDDITGDAFMFP